jgi:hypothetical protein
LGKNGAVYISSGVVEGESANLMNFLGVDASFDAFDAHHFLVAYCNQVSSIY